jgi:hypothetical protein
MGSASAAGVLTVNAATIPSPPDIMLSAIVLISIATDARLPVTALSQCYWVLQLRSQNCYISGCCGEAENQNSAFGNTFHLEENVNPKGGHILAGQSVIDSQLPGLVRRSAVDLIAAATRLRSPPGCGP